jgi:hypothetical protein
MISRKVLSALKDTLTDEAAEVKEEPAASQPEVDQSEVPEHEGEL